MWPMVVNRQLIQWSWDGHKTSALTAYYFIDRGPHGTDVKRLRGPSSAGVHNGSELCVYEPRKKRPSLKGCLHTQITRLYHKCDRLDNDMHAQTLLCVAFAATGMTRQIHRRQDDGRDHILNYPCVGNTRYAKDQANPGDMSGK